MGRRGRKRQLWKKLHKWPSLIVALFIILWAFSGIVLNHRHTFSSFDIERSLLPQEHHYRNWNNAAVRGSVQIDSKRMFLYGNAGVWEYDQINASFRSLNAGYPEGSDHHKVNCLLRTKNGKLYSGTRFGLYGYNRDKKSWEKIILHGHDQHVVDLAVVKDSLWILTRSGLRAMSLRETGRFTELEIPAPEGYDNKVGLFKTLWVIHSGEIYGLAGKLLVDGVALIFIFLTLSGLVYFFFPRIMRKRKKQHRQSRRLAWWNKWSLKWHNRIGIWLVLVLMLTTITGMFLRPPLLIAIAQSRIGKIPYSMLDDGNPWYDQLRRIIVDQKEETIYLATSEGIYIVDAGLKSGPKRPVPQPPASVMGYNVFKQYQGGHILVGSFSGLYIWNPSSGAIYDYISGEQHVYRPGPSNPLGENMVAGYLKDPAGNEYVFDYNTGALPVRHVKAFAAMPETISQLPMPLWNVALEMHTARLFKPLIGDFYILFIPLLGLSVLLILFSGMLLWIRKWKSGKRNRKP